MDDIWPKMFKQKEGKPRYNVEKELASYRAPGVSVPGQGPRASLDEGRRFACACARVAAVMYDKSPS
jgi:hypothetical protein